MDKTIQSRLKWLYYSLGGDADLVRDTEDPGVIIDAISALNLGGAVDRSVPFIVTLTPTSEDLSGIMDKTPQELFEAWTAGKTVIANVPDLSSSFVFTTASFADLDDDGEIDAAYLAANFWYNMGGQDLYMVILTQVDGYTVYPFALTPANGG